MASQLGEKKPYSKVTSNLHFTLGMNVQSNSSSVNNTFQNANLVSPQTFGKPEASSTKMANLL